MKAKTQINEMRPLGVVSIIQGAKISHRNFESKMVPNPMSGLSMKKSWTTLSFLDKITRYKPVSLTEPGDTLLNAMYRWTRPGQLR